MKKIYLLLPLLILPFFLFAHQATPGRAADDYRSFFEEAYQLHPSVPRGVLEAVAWTNTRIRHVNPGQEAPSCIGLPGAWGVMGLVEDGKGYFRNNLQTIAALSPYTVEQLKQSPRVNILGYAYAFEVLNNPDSRDPQNPAVFVNTVAALSELPSAQQGADEYAMNVFCFEVLHFLNNPEHQNKYNFPQRNIDLPAIFGPENYKVLSSSQVFIGTNKTWESGGTTFDPAQSVASTDYPPAIWDPTTCNFSSRSGTPVSAVTIHTVQGSYAGAISWFKNCNSNVSAHYVLRASDGQVTQMVDEADKAWHVGSENPYTIGLEHEGYVADAAWYTNALYNSSADLVRDIINSGYGIDGLKTWDGPPTAGLQTLAQNCYRIKGHQHYPNQTHVDPGINWDWDRFYKMINTAPSPTNYSACSGNIYDSGGSGGNYGDQERESWLIQPAGATSVTLNFSAFDLETNYDFLWVYDGSNEYAELLGKFTGNNLPPTLTANSGAFYLEFRSDCATNRAGWAANWTCTSSPLACPTPTNLNESNLDGFGVDLGWDAVSAGTSYEVRYRNSLENTWTTVPANSNSSRLSGLKADALYYWQVRTLCGASQSGWAGDQFHTASPGNVVVNECSGTFNDSGSDLANYQNNEDYTFTIAPSGASSVTVSFTSFDLELNYDFLDIYDGNSTAATSLGSFTGSSSPGTVTSSGGAITFRFRSDSWTTNSGWEANWTCQSSIAPTTAISIPDDWFADDFTATFNDNDPSGVAGISERFYQVLEYDGEEWGCNRDNGFLFETFDGDSFPNWTLQNGDWYLLNGRIHQTDTQSTNTNFYIDVNQDNSGIWLYSFSARIWSSVSSQNRRFGLHLFADSPTSSQRGNSYLIWFRQDNQTLEIYETENNALNRQAIIPLVTDPFVWYSYRVTYDPGSGELKVWRDGTLVGSWTDPTPIQAGGYVSLRCNQAHMDFDDVRVFKERGSTQNIKIGPATTEDCRYQNEDPAPYTGQVFSLNLDGQDRWSNLDFRKFRIDWTNPVAGTPVQDGPGNDLDTTHTFTELAANWTTAVDTNSGILGYWTAVGSTPGGDDIAGWALQGDSTNVIRNGLNLQHGSTYYFSVKAENLSHLESQVVSSDGILAWNPQTAVSENLLDGLRVWPNPVADFVQVEIPGISDYQVRIRDVQGRLILEKAHQGSGICSLNTGSLPAGIYLLEVGQDGQRVVRKLLKK